MPRKPTYPDLSCDCVDEKARDIDWREELGENLDGFAYAEVRECGECGESVVMFNSFGECRHEDCDNDSKCSGYLNSEGPMMNYFYPCPFKASMRDAAKAIEDLPLCVVELRGEERGLALTGGGMDLAWEICAAYIALGFLPPIHFAGRLPDMAGLSMKSDRTRKVVHYAKESASCAVNWRSNDARRVDEIAKKIKSRDSQARKR